MIHSARHVFKLLSLPGVSNLQECGSTKLSCLYLQVGIEGRTDSLSENDFIYWRCGSIKN